jgi:hypothetical protein
MAGLFAQRPRIIIHRDRDFLTDDEIARWGADFTNRDMRVFCPPLCDIENYYVDADHLATMYGQPVGAIRIALQQVMDEMVAELRGLFRSKRQEANKRFWADGGGPATDVLWPPDREVSAELAMGKKLLARVNESFSNLYGQRINLFRAPSRLLARELREFLLQHGIQDVAEL